MIIVTCACMIVAVYKRRPVFSLLYYTYHLNYDVEAKSATNMEIKDLAVWFLIFGTLGVFVWALEEPVRELEVSSITVNDAPDAGHHHQVTPSVSLLGHLAERHQERMKRNNPLDEKEKKRREEKEARVLEMRSRARQQEEQRRRQEEQRRRQEEQRRRQEEERTRQEQQRQRNLYNTITRSNLREHRFE